MPRVPLPLCIVPPSVLVALLAAPAPAAADDTLRLLPQPPLTSEPTEATPPLPRSIDPAWSVQLEPAAWYVAPSGKVRLPVSGGGFTTPGDRVRLDDLNLDSPRLQPAGELHFSAERWRFGFSGSTFSAEGRGAITDEAFRLGSVAFAAGDALDSSLDLTTVELTAGYRVFGKDFGSGSEHPENALGSVLRVYALAGARAYDVSFEVERTGPAPASADADQFFGEGLIGARAELDLGDDFTIELQLTGGGYADSDRSVLSLDVIAGFQWRPTRNVGLQIGYRQLAYDLADGENAGEFEYQGRLAGLFAGLVIRF